MRKRVFSAFFFALTFSHFVEAQLEFKPKTTLAVETGNNSSAPNSISTYTNGHAPVGNVSKVPTRELLYPGSITKVYAALMGWFGKSSHIGVGYTSDDPGQVKRQVADMASRGMDGAIFAWYGSASTRENNAAKLLMKEAELYPDFKFSIMIDHGALVWFSNGLSATDAMIMHLNYVADTFYGSPAYLRINGRPLVVEFALEMHPIDWARVRSSIRGNPMIIFRNPNGFTRPFSDGAYAWGPAQTTTSYLESFDKQSLNYSSLQTFGGTSPSFNDSLASWSEQRYVSPRCGQTWLETFAVHSKTFNTARQLEFLQIATWNDYEEGSTIESGIDNCIAVSADSSGTVVKWSLSGSGLENTIHHYTVFLSKDGQNLMPVVDLPRGTRELDLAAYKLAAGTYSAHVKAVGMPSILNQMSNAITVTIPGAAGPSAGFTVTAARQDVMVQQGSSAQVQITAAPQNGFAGSVSFACSGLPKGAACSFSSSTVNVANSVATVMATLSTTGVNSAALSGAPEMIYAGMLLPIACAGPLLLRRSRRRSVLLTIGIIAMLGFSGCGGGTSLIEQPATGNGGTSASMTPPGTYSVVIAASSGSIQQTVPIKLTVQ